MPALEQADVELTIEVGSTAVPLSKIMSLARGELLSLGRSASGPVFVQANGREIAKAAVTLIGDRVGVTLAGKA
jgi:flagellar motor switch protein FliN/FliY